MESRDFPFTIMDVASILRLRVRRRGPDHVYVDCPFCGDRRGKMNLNLRKNVWRCNYCDEGGGMLALYAKVYGVSNSVAYREICEILQTEGFAPEYTVQEQKHDEISEVCQSERASTAEVHQTYSMLMSMLTLSPAHREHLRVVRGLTNEQIEQFGFKSTPSPYICQSLTERLMKQGCTVQGIPGFYLNDRGQWTVKFYKRTSGILIPIQGADGMVHGLQIRLDHPIKDKDDPPEKAGTKYLPLTSVGKNMGTPAGSPVHFVGDPCSRVVYVTEGALKADISHALMNRTFVATMGANNVSALDPLFAFLKKNGTEEIIEAEDMDKYRNNMVNKGASKVFLMARAHGLECRRLTWNPNYKGIDDWQLALRRQKLKTKEDQEMNFKQQYLNGLCTLDHIEACIGQWHELPEDGVSLMDYLGLTQEEYNAFLQTDPSVTLQGLLDSQRRRQCFRIYQLNLGSGRAIPFAFSGIDTLHKEGYQQPPASMYQLSYDGELLCAADAQVNDVLERIFQQYNTDLPADYHGRSISPSDVVELYDSGRREYFYRDIGSFVSVKFSPMLVGTASKTAPKNLPPQPEKTCQFCRRCGGTRLYEVEFRTDYATPRIFEPVNEGTPALPQEDIPYRLSGTYCMDCQSFCDTETRSTTSK